MNLKYTWILGEAVGQFIDDGGGHFRIEYHAPLGGVDTSAPDQFIGPNKLAVGLNTAIYTGMYVPTSPVQVSWTGSASFPFGGNFIGIGELPFVGSGGTGAGIYNAAGYFIITAVYSGGNAILTAWQASDLVGSALTNIGSVTLPCAGTLGRLTFININQTVYLSAPGLCGICQIKITATTPVYLFAMSLLTNQLGCSFLREMSGRLLALNVWEVVSTVPTNYPYQVAWSADSEQYGVWNVLDGSGNPTGAGFNNLPDCEDVITGAQFVGPTGYIYRQEGISEITGLNSGIQPFNFNHLWSSYKGIGTVYPNSIDQYGSEGAFLSDNDIYSMGVSGLQPIGGTAKAGIYSSLINSNNNIFGLICPINYQGEPDTFYILVMQPITSTNPSTTTFWIYSYSTKEWTQLVLTMTSLVPLKDARQMQKYLTDGVTPVNAASGVLPVFVFQSGTTAPVIYYLPDPSNNSSTFMELMFPIELVAPFRDVTIDGIALWTPAQDGTSNIEPSINNIPYQTIVADGSGIGGYYKSYPNAENQANTFNNVQLTIQSHGVAGIGHIILYGTQTESRPF